MDPKKWEAMVGGNGWGNEEHQYYTKTNAYQDGLGHLVIEARRETVDYDLCWYGWCEYTSARLITYDTFSHKYGRFEARMKVPPGKGLWTAFWMMGVDEHFPLGGEIDIAEVLGKDPTTVYGSAHIPSSPTSVVSSSNPYTLPSGSLAYDFHVYAVEWRPNRLDYFLDGVRYATVTPESMPPGGTWVFNQQPFYLILNLAVGSRFPGQPDETTMFPADLVVDYVRVYSL